MDTPQPDILTLLHQLANALLPYAVDWDKTGQLTGILGSLVGLAALKTKAPKVYEAVMGAVSSLVMLLIGPLVKDVAAQMHAAVGLEIERQMTELVKMEHEKRALRDRELREAAQRASQERQAAKPIAPASMRSIPLRRAPTPFGLPEGEV